MKFFNDDASIDEAWEELRREPSENCKAVLKGMHENVSWDEEIDAFKRNQYTWRLGGRENKVLAIFTANVISHFNFGLFSVYNSAVKTNVRDALRLSRAAFSMLKGRITPSTWRVVSDFPPEGAEVSIRFAEYMGFKPIGVNQQNKYLLYAYNGWDEV